MKPAVHDRMINRRHTLNARDVAQAEGTERGEVKPADRLRHMRQRVRVDRVAVLRRVRQRAHAAGVHDDHRRTCHCAAIMSMLGSAILKG